MASNYRGIPRTTHDLDFVVQFPAAAVPLIFQEFNGDFYIDEAAVRAVYEPPHQFNAVDSRSALKVDFWLAGYHVATGKRTWYHLDRNEWSVHFNVSPDGKLFAGDGGDSEMVARAPDGKWIYLFRPQRVPDVARTDRHQAQKDRHGEQHARDQTLAAGQFPAGFLPSHADALPRSAPNVRPQRWTWEALIESKA